MKILGFVFILIFCSLPVFSQKNLSLSGTLIDKSNGSVPLEAASVELLTQKDSAYVSGGMSDKNGIFILNNLTPKNYILKATFIGYFPVFKNVRLTSDKPSVDLGHIEMTANAVLLKEAVVTGNRPEVAVKKDTVEYDAQSYKAGENAVVEDLLKKLPGVDVDQSGNVTAQGKAITKMYVNGKEYFRDDPTIATKNIPADIVDKVQVYDRKSDLAQMTGFDPGDDETVMNLTVRPGMMQGTVGTLQLGAGQDVQNDNDARYNENAFVMHQRGGDNYTLIARINNTNNMGGADITGGGGGGGRGGGGGGGGFNTPGIAHSQNYMFRINKEFSQNLNVNGDIRYTNQSRSVSSDVSQTTFAQALTQQELINQDYANRGKNFNSNFRIDWNPNKKNAFIISPTIRFNQTGQNGLTYDKRTNLDDDSVLLDSKSLTSSTGNTFSLGGSLLYSYRFTKQGRVFSVSLSGNYNNNNSHPNNLTYYPANSMDTLYSSINLNQRAENESLTNNFSTTFSYVEPIGHNNFIQLLYNYSYSETDSKNSTYNIMLNGQDYAVTSSIMPFDTAFIVPGQSLSVLRNSTTQQIGLNFKAERKKFSLTFGFNIDPSKATNETYQPSVKDLPYQLLPPDFTGRLPLIKGDSLISSIPINVVNYSPNINFKYNFDQRSSLRIIYSGTTNQPSADQLRDYPYVDINHPNDQTKGNPNLKPSYTNNLNANFNKYVPSTQLMYGFRMNGSYIIDDIITVTQVQGAGNGIGNLTSYQNINGDWNLSLSGMINKPLSKKFSVGNSISANLSNSNSYINNDMNTMQQRMIGDRLNLRLQLNDSLYFGTMGSINYNNVSYTAVPQNNQKLYNYAWTANMMWTFLPGWIFDSDITRNWISGYPVGYNVNQTIWNAAVTKQLFSKQFGKGYLKLQVFDILQDRKNISANQTASNLQFSQTNVIPSYFLASFIFRFSIFPKSSLLKAGDMTPRRGGFNGNRGGGGYGGRRGGGSF